MDRTKEDNSKAVQAAQPGGIDAGEGEGVPKPLDDAPAAAGAETVRSGDEVDDEQVERFYALLANIRAMRGVYTPGSGENIAGDGSAARKRLRSANPPWKPAFRLEDFEDDAVSTSRCAKKKGRSQSDGEDKGDDRDPVVALPSLSQQQQPAGARRFDSERKSI